MITCDNCYGVRRKTFASITKHSSKRLILISKKWVLGAKLNFNN
jgi:hypothetical protein